MNNNTGNINANKNIPISDSPWFDVVDIRITNISKQQRLWALYHLRTSVFNGDGQIYFLVRRVGSCRRHHNQLAVRAAHVRNTEVRFIQANLMQL